MRIKALVKINHMDDDEVCKVTHVSGDRVYLEYYPDKSVNGKPTTTWISVPIFTAFFKVIED